MDPMNKVLTLISLLFVSLSMAAQDVSVERGRFQKGDDAAERRANAFAAIARALGYTVYDGQPRADATDKN